MEISFFNYKSNTHSWWKRQRRKKQTELHNLRTQSSCPSRKMLGLLAFPKLSLLCRGGSFEPLGKHGNSIKAFSRSGWSFPGIEILMESGGRGHRGEAQSPPCSREPSKW
jgi:hypothetical protein